MEFLTVGSIAIQKLRLTQKPKKAVPQAAWRWRDRTFLRFSAWQSRIVAHRVSTAVPGGATGRLIYSKALIIVAAEQEGKAIGRIRMARIPDFDRATLHGFIRSAIEPGSTVCTDGLNSYREMKGYIHHRQVQGRFKHGDDQLLPRVHRAVSLLKRWMLGTHQGAISHQHLDDYLNEFVFRFNRRKSASRGKLFLRLAQHALQISPTTYERLVRPTSY